MVELLDQLELLDPQSSDQQKERMDAGTTDDAEKMQTISDAIGYLKERVDE